MTKLGMFSVWAAFIYKIGKIKHSSSNVSVQILGYSLIPRFFMKKGILRLKHPLLFFKWGVTFKKGRKYGEREKTWGIHKTGTLLAGHRLLWI